MNNKSKTAVIVIGSLILGYFAGAFIGVPGTSDNTGSGDISKVSVFRKSTVGSQISALEQKLRGDTLAFNNESAIVQLIGARMSDFANLVDYAVIAAGDKEELSEEVNLLKNVRELTENALQAASVASASLEYLSTGEKNDLVTDYEQASRNLVVAFMMVDRQVHLGKQFVVAADKYLEGKSAEDAPELALVRDLWANYCGESAWLNGDKEELAYWGNKTTIAGADIVEKGVQKLGLLHILFVPLQGNALGSDNRPGVESSFLTLLGIQGVPMIRPIIGEKGIYFHIRTEALELRPYSVSGPIETLGSENLPSLNPGEFGALSYCLFPIL